MSANLDYAKVKSQVRGKHGEHLPHRLNTSGWRTEWPEEFPVTITTIQKVDQSTNPQPNSQATFTVAA